MLSVWYRVICVSVLTLSILAQDTGPRKLVCSQSDGTIEAPKGYCFRANGSCSCTEDCTGSLSIENCVCTRADLIFAQEEQLANCSIWKHQAWFDYVKSSRQNSTNIDLSPPASNTPDGKGLFFSTTDNGLAWPITDGRDMGNLLIHGPHCLQMIEMFNKQILNGQPLNNIYDRLHSEHCRRLARRVLNYYQNEEKNYQVRPASLCSDFHTSYYPTSQPSAHHRADAQEKNKYKEKYGRQLTEYSPAEQAKDEGLDYRLRYKRQVAEDTLPGEETKDERFGYKIRYKRQVAEDALPAEETKDERFGYKIRYKRQLAEETLPTEETKDEGLDYRIRYKRQLAEDTLPGEETKDEGLDYRIRYKRQVAEDTLPGEEAKDERFGYKIRYKRQLAEDALPAEETKDEGLDYRIRYKRQLAEDTLPGEETKDERFGYKIRYRRELPNQTHAAAYGDSGLSYPFRYGKSVSHNNNQSDITLKPRSIYNQIYTDAEKEGSRKPSQQRIFDTISGQNLGNLLVKEWLELPLTYSERHFLAGWESELVVRTAAFGIYCIQGKAKQAPITEIRDLLLMKAK